MKKRKICIITGSRADYGLLYWLIKEVKADKKLKLQLVVTGMHLSKKYGLTYKVIEKDGFRIDEKVKILRYPNTEVGVTKTIGVACQGFANVLYRLKPDMVVLLGDRFEIFAAAVAAYTARVPIAHIHGGEVTQGALDEGFRHSITKMATLHFVTNEKYRKRVIQLGENPSKVFNYGAPALDHLYKIKLLSKKELLKSLRIKDDEKLAVVTFHPTTLERKDARKQTKILLDTVKKMPHSFVFTKANADAYGDVINNMIKSFCMTNPKRYRFVDNLGQKLYYSCLKNFDLVIGNSSSGLLEAPSFRIPVVNIGDRQKNRIKALNVINVKNTEQDIRKGVLKAVSKSFRKRIRTVRNPYDRFRDGKTCKRIKDKLKSAKLDNDVLKKKFYDWNI